MLERWQIFLKITTVTLVLWLSCGCTRTSAVPQVPAEKVHEHISSLGVQPTEHILMVDTKKQTLAVLHNGKIKNTYTISTSKRGIGQKINTFQTPQGLHRINEKIGHGTPHYSIFHRRQYVGTWRRQPRNQHRKDYISTRILRLEGLQPGLNKGRDKLGRIVDSETRAIYIHGT
ncbi:MAG TPA: L,D-transpeptidase, partial [Gammaproteobacteria bacterium]|nr:L,D-transpeptidase [Gammaproteobacteria bacterium]